MRTADICPTCSTYSNALCTLYNGAYLPSLDIQPLDSLETALIKIEAFTSTVAGATPSLQVVTDIGAVTTNVVTTPGIQLDLAAGIDPAPGEIVWNSEDESVEIGIDANSSLTAGQEDHYHVTNSSGADILDGTPVMSIGSSGASGKILIAPMDASVLDNTKYFLGLATADILNGSNGKVTKWGKVKGTDTSGTTFGEVWIDGETIWLDNTTVGGLTNVEPTVGVKLPIAFVIRAHASTGILATRATSGNALHELHDTDVTGLVDGMHLQYNATSGNWEVVTPFSGYTVGTLPAGSLGDRAYVTDATAPTYLGTLTGGGAVVCPVFHNGVEWVSA